MTLNGKQTFLSLALLIVSSTINTASADSGKDKTDSRLYHVELSIFTNYSGKSATSESWPSNLELRYPAPLLTLIQEQPEESLEISQTDIEPAATTGTQAENIEEIIDPIDSKATDENTIILLADSEKQLLPAVKRIHRTGNQRVLFHESWIQAIDSRKTAPNIAIHGGGQYDDHFELEGSIRLSRARYLHIETNLWLNSFAINVGQEGEPWPLLPSQPYIPQKSNNSDNSTSSINNIPTNNYNTFASSDIQWNDLQEFGSQFQAIIENQYLVERVVTMKQHRKMRSKELHYIDHPQMGLLLQITPYEAPEPEDITAEDHISEDTKSP